MNRNVVRFRYPLSFLPYLLSLIFCLLAFLSGCSLIAPPLEPTATSPPEPTSTPLLEPSETPVPEDGETAVPASPTQLPAESATLPPVPIDADAPPAPLTAAELQLPTPWPTFPSLAQGEVTDRQRDAARGLAQEIPDPRDDQALLMIYQGRSLDDVPPVVAPAGPLTIGTVQQIYIKHFSLDTYSQINAELVGISEEAYFWFDDKPGVTRPRAGEMEQIGREFDEIYQEVISYFGSEDRPGVDGDNRMHIVNVSPITLCANDPNTTTIPPCGLLGYLSQRDVIPRSLDPFSNEREMFVMNGSTFGSPTYLSTLAHELRHLIEVNHDLNDIDWEIEGSADLAVDLLGLGSYPLSRAEGFLANPDQQLNRWSEDSRASRYGQGYLLNRYIYDRLGQAHYREFATHPADGLDAVSAVTFNHNLGFTGLELWLDWLVAAGIHNLPNVPDTFKLSGIRSTAYRESASLGSLYETTVNQYAADYYALPADEPFTITFSGTTHTPLFQAQPTSGDRMWVTRRTNSSQARLTRHFDLRTVSAATLRYDLYRDIEQGFDYAYLLISTDDGAHWEPLVAPNMDGLIFEDNPGNIALAERYYTGQNGQWVTEEIDLTPYAGQQIVLRFEYITDAILAYDGLALDNLMIPEIGFIDTVELDEGEGAAGWQAEGFVRSTGYMPQTWHLQLVTPTYSGLEIESFVLDNLNRFTRTFEPVDGPAPPLLIVAATAPVTLSPAVYRLEIK